MYSTVKQTLLAYSILNSSYIYALYSGSDDQEEQSVHMQEHKVHMQEIKLS